MRRNPREYFTIFDAATSTEPDGRRVRFELVSCKCVDTYVRVKHNQNQARLLARGRFSATSGLPISFGSWWTR